MEKFRSTPLLRQRVEAWRRAGERIALVPTMGALHEGHLSLVRAARREAGRVIVSLFVNPKQFAANEDLKTYPRDEGADGAALAPLGVDVLFAPDVEAVYPAGYATAVSVARLGDRLCGAHRPGHFDGVATVVAKLFMMSGADLAYFGEKDWQQLQIVRRMARDLNIPVEIRAMATVREADGLAMSSRNLRLSAGERHVAAALPLAMRAAVQDVRAGASVAEACRRGAASLITAGFRAVDYFEVADGETLEPLASAGMSAHPRLFAAASIGPVRLIDNIALNEAP